MFEIRFLLMRWRRDDFAADTEDGRGVRGLDDAADGRWPMVMELFTKMEKLMLAAAMLPPPMPPLMLHLSARAVTVEHRKACIVSTVVQFSWRCTIVMVKLLALPQYDVLFG